MGIRVVIADGFQILLEGLAAILTSRGGVVGMTRTGEEAVLVVRQRDADVLSLDRDLPGLDSSSATKSITKERPSITVREAWGPESDASRCPRRPVGTV